ncbi:MAG: 4-(cytidine 5'-diphospho)-2-C-methyl-D-erythritol kinase [Acutalibacteraceae bacterium]|nr:4-(cytidine 5'-diphospho)-2-C-methyl-D-erythritol kinase [Acutalibacteraceae bacterium]
MKLRLLACAKINLALDITGVRDDGYHLLSTIMQSVGICDEVIVDINNSGCIQVESSLSELGGEADITHKAAKLFYDKTLLPKGVSIYVNKKIPCAAGLGGGSADAAAVLMALNKLYNYPLSDDELEAIALELGADVPFCLYGGTMLAEGIGEVLTPLNDMPSCYIVIAKNAQKPSTKEMYARIDNGEASIVDIDSTLNAIKNGDYNLLCDSVDNAFARLWSCDDINSVMKASSADAISLSGSGPSYFALFENEEKAKACYDQFVSLGIEAYLTTPTKTSIIFE